MVLLNWLDFSTTTSTVDAKILGTLQNSIGCTIVIHVDVTFAFGQAGDEKQVVTAGK